MIKIRGARTHNLKNISLDIPQHQLVVITGVSGSGKSSLAFDTIYAEGERRYLESLSSYARQFLQNPAKPDVDSIEGLSPAISIRQKTISHNPRSTVGTITEIYDYLRVLMANFGVPYCPYHHHPIVTMSVDEIIHTTLSHFQGKGQILAPVVIDRKGKHEKIFEEYLRLGYLKAIVNGEVVSLEEPVKLDKNKKHQIDIVIDRMIFSQEERTRLSEAIESSLSYTNGLVKIVGEEETKLFSTLASCTECGFSFPEKHPRVFSFNTPEGACEKCHGLGYGFALNEDLVFDKTKSIEEGGVLPMSFDSKAYARIFRSLSKKYHLPLKEKILQMKPEYLDKILLPTEVFEGLKNMIERRYEQTNSLDARSYYEDFMEKKACEECQETRINLRGRNILFEGKNIAELSMLSISNLKSFFSQVAWEKYPAGVVKSLMGEIDSRLSFLIEVGLEYLSLGRRSDTLSGGESQRIRLASQIGTKLNGVLYVLDEPTIGLHQRDNERLIRSLLALRDLGNSILVVEHDEQCMKEADFIVDIGPKAGVYGGEVTFTGSFQALLSSQTLTSDYLNFRRQIEILEQRRISKEYLVLKGVESNNLKKVEVKIPLGIFVGVTGVSGSGKSSLIQGTLVPALQKKLGLAANHGHLAKYRSIEGFESIQCLENIDQRPIGKTPRSNPATYLKVFDLIREIFARTEEGALRGFTPSRFSFNVKGGRCETCQGYGYQKIAMHFMSDVKTVCSVCHGKMYNKETLEVRHREKTIFDVLQMNIDSAANFFQNHKQIVRILNSAQEVGLGYLKLGQPSSYLSGGESQRLKLARELSIKRVKKTLYVLDEPTTGLHFYDVHLLIRVLQNLVEQGHSVVVIEHNLDLIKSVDYLIDLGPEGGENGGEILFCGTPEELSSYPHSYTGKYLKGVLELQRKKRI